MAGDGSPGTISKTGYYFLALIMISNAAAAGITAITNHQVDLGDLQTPVTAVLTVIVAGLAVLIGDHSQKPTT